jgi:hypothetical protein
METTAEASGIMQDLSFSDPEIEAIEEKKVKGKLSLGTRPDVYPQASRTRPNAYPPQTWA